MTYFDIWSHNRRKAPVREEMTRTTGDAPVVRGKVCQRPNRTSHSLWISGFVSAIRRRERSQSLKERQSALKETRLWLRNNFKNEKNKLAKLVCMLSRKRIFFQTLPSVGLVMSLLGKKARARVWTAWGFACYILFLLGSLNQHSLIGEENSVLLSTVYTCC